VAVEIFAEGGLQHSLVGDPLAGALFVSGDKPAEPAIVLAGQAQAECVDIGVLFQPL
jgi:hypothetical protein